MNKLFKKPKHNKGDIVFALHPTDKQKIIMCEVLGAESTTMSQEAEKVVWYYSVVCYALAEKVDIFMVHQDDLFSEYSDVPF